jgi:hypothetical protein
VKRDASGNFSAGTIAASLTGNATTATTANNFSGSLAGDVTGTQGATLVASVGGQSAGNVASGASAANAAASAATANTIVKRDASGNFSAGTIAASLSGNATTASTANNFSGSLVGEVTGTQNATLVASVGGQSAGNVASGASAANAATSAATASTIVMRDAGGNFTSTSITLNGNLNLPATTASAGVIYSGGQTLIHSYGNYNFFAGESAGNFTMTGPGDNTGVGFAALSDITSGSQNTAIGYGALHNNTTGPGNTASGIFALYSNTSGAYNTANGYSALDDNTSGFENTAYGFGALNDNLIGSYNTASGYEALFNNTSGSNNIALGYLAGYNLKTGSTNIDIGNPGVSTDNNIIRIGSGQTSAFINAASLTVSGTLSAPNTIYADSTAGNTGALNPGLIFGGTGSSEGISSKRTSGTDQYGLDFYTQGIIRMTVNNSGYVGIGTTTPGYLLVVGGSGSPAYCNGTSWVNGSDRNSKEAFTAINPRAVLEKVSALPITEWKYKVEADGTEHLGPMAQDFHAAFGLNGPDDKHIATVDEEGVALAAIQGLNQKVEEQLKAKDAKIQDLEGRLEKLEQALATRNGGGK